MAKNYFVLANPKMAKIYIKHLNNKRLSLSVEFTNPYFDELKDFSHLGTGNNSLKLGSVYHLNSKRHDSKEEASENFAKSIIFKLAETVFSNCAETKFFYKNKETEKCKNS